MPLALVAVAAFAACVACLAVPHAVASALLAVSIGPGGIFLLRMHGGGLWLAAVVAASLKVGRLSRCIAFNGLRA